MSKMNRKLTEQRLRDELEIASPSGPDGCSVVAQPSGQRQMCACPNRRGDLRRQDQGHCDEVPVDAPL